MSGEKTSLNKSKVKNQNSKLKNWGLGLAAVFILMPLAWLRAQPLNFEPNNLIADERFVDTATLGGAEGVQKFLESKNSVLANLSPDFLPKLREPGDGSLKSRLPDPRPALGRPRTAAELIYDAATAAGLNPQVVLATLQKEQSLITGQFVSPQDLQRALDRALGFGCPEEGGCGEIFLGFYHQLFGNFDGAGNRFIGMPFSLTRSFYFEVGGVRVGRGPLVDGSGNAYGNGNRIRTSRKGDVITVENTKGPPDFPLPTQTVTLSNFATTALYRYTPHVYNGNYNFWKFFNEWFRYPNGTLIQSAGDSQIYIVDNGLRRLISAFVMQQRGLSIALVENVSVGELSEFVVGQVMVPLEGTILQSPTGRYFLVEEGKRKLLSSFVASQRKLNFREAVLLPDEEIQTYPEGGKTLPLEGTLVKAKENPAVYMITNHQKRLLSALVFGQRGLKFSDVLEATAGELEDYPAGGLLPPLDGTLIKAKEEPKVYHVGNGALAPLSLFVFEARGFKFKDILTVAKSELLGWEMGKPMPPPTGLLVKAKDNPTVYYVESGVRRPVSYAVFVASRFSFKAVRIGTNDELNLIELGEDLRLPERALVKTKEEPAVYYVVDGVLRPLTLKAFGNRRLRFEDVVEVPAEELAKYQTGAVVEN